MREGCPGEQVAGPSLEEDRWHRGPFPELDATRVQLKACESERPGIWQHQLFHRWHI